MNKTNVKVINMFKTAEILPLKQLEGKVVIDPLTFLEDRGGNVRELYALAVEGHEQAVELLEQMVYTSSRKGNKSITLSVLGAITNAFKYDNIVWLNVAILPQSAIIFLSKQGYEVIYLGVLMNEKD